MRKCAVITPVSGETAPGAKAGMFRALARAHGWHILLPALDSEAEAMTLACIASADLVIADISHERPSCYFELGYAVALGRPVLLVAREGTAVHYTHPDHRTVFYRSLSDLGEIVADALETESERIEHA